jgi:uncharacterized protein YdiU (UPF0061 family)
LLAESPEAAVEVAQDVLKTYAETYQQAWLTGMRAKCGLANIADASTSAGDKELIEALFNIMDANNADFTLAFYYLSQLGAAPSDKDNVAGRLFDDPAQFDDWLVKWRARVGEESATDEERKASMQAVNPVYIPRNHQIEAAIRAAEDQGDFSVFHALHEVLQHPFTQQQGKDRYMQPPEPEEVVRQTFCGT